LHTYTEMVFHGFKRWAYLLLVVHILFSPRPIWATCVATLGPDGRTGWSVDGPDSSYESSMRATIEGLGRPFDPEYFSNLLKARRANHQSTHVLDLMGSGYFLKDQKVADSITGLRLEPLQLTDGQINRYGTRAEVVGDIFDPQTWENLKRNMKERRIPGFDLIVMRPEGGWQQHDFGSTDAQATSLVTILSKALSLLNPSGEIYFALSQSGFEGSTETHPAIVAFQQKLAKETPYRMSLHSTLRWTGTETIYTEGAIRPASQP